MACEAGEKSKMTEQNQKLLTLLMQSHSELLEGFAANLKEIADALDSSRDARTIYNTLGPIDAAVESLRNAVGRLEG